MIGELVNRKLSRELSIRHSRRWVYRVECIFQGYLEGIIFRVLQITAKVVLELVTTIAEDPLAEDLPTLTRRTSIYAERP